jgi:hypothetical protein
MLGIPTFRDLFRRIGMKAYGWQVDFSRFCLSLGLVQAPFNSAKLCPTLRKAGFCRA